MWEKIGDVDFCESSFLPPTFHSFHSPRSLGPPQHSMSVEQPDSALTDDEWLAQLLEPPQLPNPPQQPSHDISILPNYYDSLDHDIHIDRDLDLSLPLPPACFSTNSSLSAPPQAHSIGSFPILSSSAREVSGPRSRAPYKCTVSSPRPGQGQGQGQGEVGFYQIVDTCFTEGRRSGDSLLQYILRNRTAHGIPPSQVGIALSRGATAFLTGMERSGFKLRNDSTLTAPTHPIQHGSCAGEYFQIPISTSSLEADQDLILRALNIYIKLQTKDVIASPSLQLSETLKLSMPTTAYETSHQPYRTLVKYVRRSAIGMLLPRL